MNKKCHKYIKSHSLLSCIHFHIHIEFFFRWLGAYADAIRNLRDDQESGDKPKTQQDLEEIKSFVGSLLDNLKDKPNQKNGSTGKRLQVIYDDADFALSKLKNDGSTTQIVGEEVDNIVNCARGTVDVDGLTYTGACRGAQNGNQYWNLNCQPIAGNFA